MKQTAVRVVRVCAILAPLASCITVGDQENRMVDAQRMKETRLRQIFSVEQIGVLQVRSLVYKPDRLPLGKFLKKLSRGKYEDAFKSARLRYAPSNTDDEALKTLIREGFIPIFVDVVNTGPEPADLARLRWALDDAGRELLAPIPNQDLPSEFEKLNPKAIAANVYNTGAVVVGYAALMTALAVAMVTPCRGMEIPCKESPMWEMTNNFVESLDTRVYNPVRKAIVVDYSSLLWSPRILAPGASATGLLFFRVKNSDWGGLRLQAQLVQP